jgi:hypothetical protein
MILRPSAFRSRSNAVRCGMLTVTPVGARRPARDATPDVAVPDPDDVAVRS